MSIHESAIAAQASGELIDDAGQFFAPMSADLVDGLVGEYSAMRGRIEALADAVGQECYAGALHYFIEGNQSSRERWFNIERLFSLEGAIAKLNATFWNKALQLTDVLDTMPQKRRDEWFEQINNPLGVKRDKYDTEYTVQPLPDFEESTVRATLGDLMAGRSRFFAERIDGIFRALSSEHVTNCPQGFGKRMILANVHSNFYSSSSQCGHINDLRAVIAKFMGRDEPRWDSSRRVVDIARRSSGEWMPIDGGSIRIRVYKVGTAHLEVHPEMAWRLNAVLASLHPAAIPAEFRTKPKRTRKLKDFELFDKPLPFAVLDVLAAMKPAHYTCCPAATQHAISFDYSAEKVAKDQAAAVLAAIGGAERSQGGMRWFEFDYAPRDVIDQIVCTGCIPDQKSHQFYPTPRAVAEAAIELAEIGPGHLCLEPSAGIGGLADLMPMERTRCVEISKLHCEILTAKGFLAVACDDFLAWAALPGQARYDRIVMNPPFSEGRWQAHLEAAAGMLAPDGRLVAILPASAKGKELLPGFWHTYSRTFDNEFAGTSVSVTILVAEAL